MNTAEYNSCVDQHADGVFRFILHHVKNRDDASDVVQDAFEKLWKVHGDVQAAKAKSYLYTTAYRTLIDRLRKESKNVLMEEGESYEHHSEQTQYSDLKELLQEALNKLPSIQKTVVLLRDYEGYDYAEIGQITGLNESQVKVYIYRARLALKNYIGSISNVV